MTSGGGDVFGVFRIGDLFVGVPIDNLAEVCAVPAVSRLITEKGPILGAFDLRGNMVPLVDSLVLAEAGEFDRPVRKAALIQHDGRLVAIALDEVINLFEASSTAPVSHTAERGQSPAKPEGAKGSMFAGGFVMEGAIVSCMDAEALLEKVSRIAVAQSRKSSRRTEMSQRNKYLVFAAGRVKFAVETEHIWGTVPKGRLDHENVPVGDGLFLGFVHHIGSKIPVIDTNMVLGIGQSSRSDETEVVVIRLSDERLIGLHVNATERIMAVEQEKKTKTSALLSRNKFLKEVCVEREETQVFIVDHEALSNDTDIASISELVVPPDNSHANEARERDATRETSRSQTSYLVFKAGNMKAVLAKQIVRIIRKPLEVIPSNSVPSEVQGFFAYGKRSVPIISLSDPPPENLAEYVLIVSYRGEQIGFMANEICGVRTPDRKITCSDGQSDESTLIQFKEQGEKRLVPLIDLERAADAIYRRLEA